MLTDEFLVAPRWFSIKTNPTRRIIMSKHLIVISVDALVFEDLEYARNLPAFQSLLERGSIVERITTVYPSSTHPVHASIITGVPTGDTGIICNKKIFKDNPIDTSEWFNSLDDIKAETIFHAAKRAGLTTAAAHWPLNTHGKHVIDYLVPNAMNEDFIGYENNPIEAYKALGATKPVLDIITEAYTLYGYENEHPGIDNFQTHCCVEIIKRFKPNLLLTHPGDVDAVRHDFGVFNDKVNLSLERTDRWIGQIVQATKDAGIYDDTDFVVLGDHGQINVMRAVRFNTVLKEHGFIRTDDQGKLLSYDAIIRSNGASALVYLSRPNDEKLVASVYKLLSDYAKSLLYGFEAVFTAEEAKAKYGLFGDFSFVIETDGYTAFSNLLDGPTIVPYKTEDCKYCRATHGYAPEKGPQTTFFAAGPSIKKGVTIPRGSVLNHAPTFAAILGVSLSSAVGKPVTEILK